MAKPPPDDLKRVYRVLARNHEALSLPERRKLAQRLLDGLQKGGTPGRYLPLMRLLAGDPKAEVRADIAEAIAWLPEDDFLHLAAQLGKDDNAYVQRASERALARRRKGEHEAERRQRGLDQIRAEYEDMEKIHGTMAAEKARAMAERLYDVLVGSTVHNMRGTVAGAKLSAVTLLRRIEDGKHDPAAAKQVLGKIVTGLSLLERLVSNMRAYSRLPSAERRPERLATLAREAVTMVLAAQQSCGRLKDNVDIKIDIDPGITASVSKDAVAMVLNNLITNAYEAFPKERLMLRQGNISIRARNLADDNVELVVTDNGAGMNKEELASVRQLNPGQTTLKRDGTGFGLPIAHRYVAAHGGRLEIDSIENEGTRVTIILPKNSHEESGA